MHLDRVTPDEAFRDFQPYPKFAGQISKDFEPTYKVGEDGKPMVAVHFKRYGGGKKRHSDYDVCVEWSDMEALIDCFANAGNADAQSLREAWKLAQAAKTLGWQEPTSAVSRG
jgi:hypothetical protein